MTTAPTPALRTLAEAAEANGQHIYTNPRDSNKWRENEAWHRAASPGAVLHLLDRIAELEARKPLPWEPGFDFMTPGQEDLAMQFCLEIAGPRGQKGSPPDPVRLLEMCQALYKAEVDARPKET